MPLCRRRYVEPIAIDLPTYLSLGLFATHTVSFYGLLRKEA